MGYTMGVHVHSLDSVRQVVRPFSESSDNEEELLMIMHPSTARLLLGAALLAGTLEAQHASVIPLFQLKNVQGACYVNRPGATASEPAIDHKAYPFGTSVQTEPAGSAVIAFTGSFTDVDISAAMGKSTDVRVDREPGTPTNHIISLLAGELQVFADRDTPEQALSVATPDFSVYGFSGRSAVKVLPATADLITTRVAVAKGGVSIIGNQFSVANMRVGCALRIESTPDRSLTRITSEAGEIVITLENGTDEPLLFNAYPRSTVKIWREYAPVGGRLIVAVFAVGPDGKRPECYAFSVGRTGVRSVDDEDIDKENADQPAADAFVPPPAALPEIPVQVTPAPDADTAFKEMFGDAFDF